MENYDNTSNYESQSNANTEKKSFKDSSPDEIKERVKETVSKGVAAVAGALKGFTEEAKKNDLPNATKEVIQKAGETTRSVAGTAKQEYQSTKAELKGSGQSSSIGSSSLESGSFGSTSIGSTSGSLGMGGSSLGTTGIGESSTLGKSSDVPDLRKTQLSKSDDELSQ